MQRRSVVALGLLALASCVPPQAPPPDYSGQPGAQPTECKMGSDGQQACGYHCMMGSDGHTACADTPNGRCAMGSDGRVTCTQLAGPAGAPPPGSPPPECRMGSDGQQYCGYNCRMGSNGRFYCASRPDGQCALNSDGTFACP
jgi:hypothetical protein